MGKITLEYEVVPQYDYHSPTHPAYAGHHAVVASLEKSFSFPCYHVKIFWGSEDECNDFLTKIFPLLEDNLNELSDNAKHPEFEKDNGGK